MKYASKSIDVGPWSRVPLLRSIIYFGVELSVEILQIHDLNIYILLKNTRVFNYCYIFYVIVNIYFFK